jgi:hypothetical protein
MSLSGTRGSETDETGWWLVGLTAVAVLVAALGFVTVLLLSGVL